MPCNHVQEIIAAQVVAVSKQIDRLRALRDELHVISGRLDGETTADLAGAPISPRIEVGRSDETP
jgi:hypothetical protein